MHLDAADCFVAFGRLALCHILESQLVSDKTQTGFVRIALKALILGSGGLS